MIYAQNRLAYRCALLVTMIALLVILLGAYTRLKDAGLGCPDWPGCYGQLVAPHTPPQILRADANFPNQLVQTAKAWPEMIHRYAAGTLGFLICIAALLTLRKQALRGQPTYLALALIAVVIFQALLGKWTVTLRLLPGIVELHLLCGMLLLTLLWLLTMRLGRFFAYSGLKNLKHFRPWAIAGLIILSLQIILGGWTSVNYAALVCPDFPFCQGTILPRLDFSHAFHLGLSFQTGLLANNALITIHLMHRLGGFITTLYLSALAICLLCSTHIVKLQRIAWTILLLVALQLSLGILNVLWYLPLPIAVAHNGIAALLLLTVVTLNYALSVGRNEHREAQRFM